jgi:hypothetical protein
MLLFFWRQRIVLLIVPKRVGFLPEEGDFIFYFEIWNVLESLDWSV